MSTDQDKKQYDAAAIEKKWQEHWLANRTYRWDPTIPRDQSYIIDTPPPTVSGFLHMGHIFSYTQTDIIARFQRMTGKNVFYPIGFDDNGLPTERLVEKQKNIRAADLPRAEFIKLCHEVVAESENEFRDLFRAIALSVDWSQEYRTISDDSRRMSQMSVIDLFRKGHLYREPQPSLWDPADKTALAQAEVTEKEQPGTLWQIPFTLEAGGNAVIATTRPELLAACVALFIHPDHPKAKALVGKKAISPLFSVQVPILADEKADPEKGTGIVMCCTFGDVTDIEWWRRHSLQLRVIVDEGGRMNYQGLGALTQHFQDPKIKPLVETLQGLTTKQARAKTIEILKERGLVLGEETVTRMVPCAERSGAPLEIIVTPQWFVRVLDKKADLIEAGRKIAWYPQHMRVRFEQWTENLRWDWCISRQRYFGVPFPFWYSKRAGEEGKILVADPGQLPVDPLVDLPKGYNRAEVTPDMDVMDTWATSSVSPQINSHGIAEGLMVDEARHRLLYPAHLRPQAHEIIRTWAFYTIVKSWLHEKTIPWEHITLSGWCLAEDRSKMSKSKGNVVTPQALLEKYGSDVVRYWTATSRLGFDTTVSEDVMKVGKRLVTKLWNAARFALAAARALPGDASFDPDSAPPLDLWLVDRLSRTIESATWHFGRYDYADALRVTEEFFWKDLCDNYLELIKGRVYGEAGGDADGRQSALGVLMLALDAVLRLLAPVLPHVTEELYGELFPETRAVRGSIHACHTWPDAGNYARNEQAAFEGRLAVDLLAAARKVKSQAGVSIKTPVARCVVSGWQKTKGDEQMLFMPATLADLRSAMNASPALEFEWREDPVQNLPSAADEENRFAVQLELVPEPMAANG